MPEVAIICRIKRQIGSRYEIEPISRIEPAPEYQSYTECLPTHKECGHVTEPRNRASWRCARKRAHSGAHAKMPYAYEVLDT